MGSRGETISRFLRIGRGQFHRPWPQRDLEAMAAQTSQLEFVHSSQFTTPIAEEYAAEFLKFAGEQTSEVAQCISPAAARKRLKLH